MRSNPRPKLALPLLLAAALALLQGCWVRKADVDEAVDATGRRIGESLDRSTAQRPVVTVRPGHWLAGREIPLDQPSAPELQQRVRLAAAAPASLREIAQRIAQVTRIPVTLEPDLAPSTASAGGRVKAVPAPAAPSLPPLPPIPGPGGGPALPDLPPPAGGGPDLGFMASLDDDAGEPGTIRWTYRHDGPLSDLLDRIATRFGIAWEYKGGRITLSRFQTRTFILHLPADVRTVEAEVGGKAMGQAQNLQGITGGATGSFGALNGAGGGFPGGGGMGGATGGGGGAPLTGGDGVNQSVTTEARLETWKEIESALPRLLSPVGHFAVAPSSGEITVTDTPAGVKRVGDYVDRKNADLTRQVAVQVDVLAIDDKDGDDFEINWKMIFDNGELGLALVNPAMVQGPATNLAMQILRPTSDFKGTSVLIKAMASQLRSRLVTTTVATTLNNHPAPVQVTRTDGYLRSIQSNVATGVGNVVQTSLVPGQITTGLIMTLTPRFLDHDRLMLTYNIDLSRLLPFTTASVGSGDNAASIQIPNFERRAFMQAVAVKAGDTLVLSGFEQADDEAQLDAPIHPENTLFGSRQMKRNRSRLVILLTPVIVGNGTV